MNNYGIKFSLIGILVAALLSAVFIKTQTSHHLQHDQVLEAFESYQQTHARLDQNVLMSRYDILAHYDPLVNSSAELIRIVDSLQSKELAIYQQGETSIDQALDNLRSDAEQKAALIEHFKSRNAILKNSLRYLPVAIHQLVEGLAADSNKASDSLLLNDLLGAILSYNITADNSFRDKVVATLKIIEQRQGEFASQYRDELGHIINHASTIIKEKTVVDGLVDELIFEHNTESLSAVFNAYKHYNAEHNADAAIFRILLYLLAIGLLMYVGYAVIKLRNNAVQLNRAYADLNYQKFAMDQHSIVSTTDAAGKITYANQRFVDISEFSLNELLGQSHSIINSGHQSPEFFADMWRTITAGQVWHGEIKNKQKGGGYYWVNSTIVPFMDESNRPYQYISIRTDITTQKATEEALLREKELAEITLHSITDGVITTDNQGQVTYLNPMAANLIGCDAQQGRGQHFDKLLNLVDENNHEPVTGLISPCLAAHSKVKQNNLCLVQNAGASFSIEIAATPLFDHQERLLGTVIVLHDVTETRNLTQQMTYLASHDSLTGLVNRREFKNRLGNMLDSARRYDREHALCYIDLDQFKIINDTCGHIAGDELLKQLTNVLTDIVRSRDTLARLGGDEFGLLLGDCPPDRAMAIAQNICDTVKNFRYVWDKKTFEVGASIGVVQINKASDSPTELMSLADTACYTAKDNGRNRVHIYQEDDAELQQRYGEMQWIPRLSKALAEDQFVLHCQPIQALKEHNEGEHFEVLIRLRSENGELVPPGAFIPAAERYNIMPAIDRWVIEQTFSTYSRYYQNHPEAAHDTCAINLSGTSLNDADFLAYIEEQLDRFQLPAHIFCFEVTETAAISNLSTAVVFIQALKDKGCKFSLDDFGSGVSSFSYLKKLPVDYLKIDGNFIIDMLDDPIDRAMVKSINEVGHVMKIKTIAEYIETRELQQLAKEIGIDYGQGYRIGKPMPMDEFLTLQFGSKQSGQAL